MCYVRGEEGWGLLYNLFMTSSLCCEVGVELRHGPGGVLPEGGAVNVVFLFIIYS